MLYTKEKLNEIKSKIDYYEWYKQYLPELKHTGSYRAFSPCCFHNETKPSLCIDTVQGLWRCFGSCNTGGDIFSFYMKYFNVSFTEAVQNIAEQYGVELEVDPEVQKEIEYKKALFGITKIITNKYEQALENDLNAWNYLTKIRNIRPKIIKEFQIGRGIDKLPDKQSLKELGLLAYNKNNELYAKFRSGRVTLPYKDEQGNITSFVGRYIGDNDNGYKYMYTTDTIVHKKAKSLFGIYNSRKYIKKFNSVVCCEGQFDMISLYQNGIVNSVSTGGLNISDEQVNILKKYTNVFYYCLEDNAPLKENDNGLTSLDKFYDKIKEHIPYAKVYIVDLRQNGEKCDPDMYLQNHTKDEFKLLMRQSKIYNEFIINEKLKGVNPKNIEEKTACVNMVIPLLSSISDFFTRKQYIELVSNKLCVPENDLYRKIKFQTEKQDKLNTDNISYDTRPVFAQKILLSTCFANNFNQLKTTFLVGMNALEYMEPFYKMIYNDYISPYIKKYINEPKVDFTDFFSELSCNDEINPLIKKSIMDIYMKTEVYEDLDDSDSEELIDEQIETLKEYAIPTSETDTIDISV